MRDFLINILTRADLSGTNAAAPALRAVAEAGAKVVAEERAAGRSADELSAKVDKLRDAKGKFVSLGEGAAAAGKSMRELSGESEGFLSKVKTGFGLGLGDKLLHGVEEIGHAFSDAVREGIAYNAEMETLGVGLGATLRSVEPDKYLNFDAARKAGVQTLEELRQKSNELGVDFHGMAESYGANLNALIEGGVTRTSQQITLISTLILQAISDEEVTSVEVSQPAAKPSRHKVKTARALPLQRGCKPGSNPLPPEAQTRRASLDLSASEEAEFEAGERLQFTGAGALA